MPESKSRPQADAKKKASAKAELAAERADKQRRSPSLKKRAWVAPTFVTLMLLGVLWLVVWYLSASTGNFIPGMSDIGNWNLLIAMGLMAASFGVATLWQ